MSSYAESVNGGKGAVNERNRKIEGDMGIIYVFTVVLAPLPLLRVRVMEDRNDAKNLTLKSR